MDILTIKYETGYMKLKVNLFFPVTLNKARKLLPLINTYCTDEDRNELLQLLIDKAEFYKQGCKECANKAANTYDKKEVKFWTSRFNKVNALYKRTIRNIELLDVG